MKKDSAVSSVISEVLLILLVLIVIPMVTISLMNQLPQDRVPTVTIKMGSLNSTGSLNFYHKGGDWIKKEDIQIIQNGIRIESWKRYYNKPTFDLGDKIPVPDIIESGNISFVVKNAIIFSGVAICER